MTHSIDNGELVMVLSAIFKDQTDKFFLFIQILPQKNNECMFVLYVDLYLPSI